MTGVGDYFALPVPGVATAAPAVQSTHLASEPSGN